MRKASSTLLFTSLSPLQTESGDKGFFLLSSASLII